MINSPTPLTYQPVGTAGLTSEKISLRLAADKTIIFLSSGHMLAAPRVELTEIDVRLAARVIIRISFTVLIFHHYNWTR